VPPQDEGKVVKLMRAPIDTHCSCSHDIAFGAWCYYNWRTMEALCIECSVKKGWSPKDRVTQLITMLELREDVKALRNQKKIESDGLMLLREKVDLHRLGERDLELEGQITKLMSVVTDYLQHCASVPEKEGLERVFEVITETQKLQKEIRELIENRMFLLDRKANKLPSLEEFT
jgi:GTPase SAR1 family protein